jgi:hypothetical protein
MVEGTIDILCVIGGGYYRYPLCYFSILFSVITKDVDQIVGYLVKL